MLKILSAADQESLREARMLWSSPRLVLLLERHNLKAEVLRAYRQLRKSSEPASALFWALSDWGLWTDALGSAENMAQGADREWFPVATEQATSVGEVVRRIRETAGMSRRQLARQTKVAASSIRNLEIGRRRTSAGTMQKLLKHPAMATLNKEVKEAGLSLELDDSRK